MKKKIKYIYEKIFKWFERRGTCPIEGHGSCQKFEVKKKLLKKIIFMKKYSSVLKFE